MSETAQEKGESSQEAQEQEQTQILYVEQIQHIYLSEPIKVYNFEVDEAHTYYIGEQEILVHNTCGDIAGNKADNLANEAGDAIEGGTATENQVINNIRNKVPNEELTPPTSRGNAPLSNKDGRPIEIHHNEQSPTGPFDEMHPSDHRYGENYQKNHPNYNQPSKIDRTQFRKDKRGYWENEWDNGRWD